MQTQRTILVTGATGTVGSQLVRSLAQAPDLHVRAFVRNLQKADALANRRIELCRGSFEDTDRLSAALRGVDTLVLITPTGPMAAEQAQVAIAGAKAAGVRKIVRLSAIRASIEGPTENSRQHAQTERELRESGLAYALLRPQFYMQNLLGAAGSVVNEGKLYSAVDDGRIGMIDARDVADCLERAVGCSDYDGRAWELSGPQSITHDSVAAVLGEALGRTVACVRVSPEFMSESMRAFGADDWMVRLMADYTRAYRDGFGDFVTDVVETMTGRPARGIETFAREVYRPVAAMLSPGASAGDVE